MLSALRQDWETWVGGVPKDLTQIMDKMVRPIEGYLGEGKPLESGWAGVDKDGRVVARSEGIDCYWPLEEDYLTSNGNTISRPKTGETWIISLDYHRPPLLIRDNRYCPCIRPLCRRTAVVEPTGRIWVFIRKILYTFNIHTSDPLTAVDVPVKFAINYVLAWKNILYLQEKKTAKIWRWDTTTNEIGYTVIDWFNTLVVDPWTGLFYYSFRNKIYNEEKRLILERRGEIESFLITPAGQLLIEKEIYG